MVLSEKDLKHIIRSLKKASRLNHRRMLVLCGNDDSSLMTAAAEVVRVIADKIEIRHSCLYAYHAFFSDGVARKEMFEKLAPEKLDFEYISYHESTKILGRTYDIAVLDLINNLEPNDLGRLSGVVNGGGLYILLTPSFKTYDKVLTRFQSLLVTPQYGPEHVRKLFVKRFIKKLFEHEGIAIYDVDRRKFLKRFKELTDREISKRIHRRELEYPEKMRLPKVAYLMAMTQDQVRALKIMEVLYEKLEGGKKIAIVITADRGRGKSSVIGIGLAALAHRLRKAKGRCRILVTAPSSANVQELLKFAKKTLEKLNHKVEVDEEDGLLMAVKAKGIEIEYFRPLDAVRRRADIIAVDEAASLHVPMLFAVLKNFDKVIYSSTIHGYEGAGRGFSIRFLKRLKQDENTRVYELEMEEPIRYAEGDPIEKWAFDTLLLDAEPAKLDSKDIECVEKLDVTYYVPNLEEFFLRQEDLLRQFIGIYIMAHYRNNPNDLGMMMDAPHHTIRAVLLRTGKVVVSLELAEEGPLKGELAKESAKGAWIMGNIIPDRVIKHYKLLDFGDFRGWRIVRIATHPDVMSRGLGSKALAFIEQEAREKGYDWIGAGFGITKELLNFWLKNGFVPVHLSPERNPVSGEYSVLVIKPLNDRVKKFIDVISWEFKKRLLGSLPEPYHDLNPRVARLLLLNTPFRDASPRLSDLQIGRFMSYAWGDMTLENCMDCMVELAKTYFMDKDRPQLTPFQELLLITRVLQAKSWRVTCEELQITPPQAMEGLRLIAQKLSARYFGVESVDEADKYLFMSIDKVAT